MERDPETDEGAAARRDETVPGAPAPRRGVLARYWWVAGLAIAAVVAVLAAILASRAPDGLDSVAAQQGFEAAARKPGFEILPGYTIPGLDGAAGTIVAGVVGTAIVFLAVVILGRLLARRRKGSGG